MARDCIKLLPALPMLKACKLCGCCSKAEYQVLYVTDGLASAEASEDSKVICAIERF